MQPKTSTAHSRRRTRSWVDEVLLAGPDSELCLHLGSPVDRALLRDMVDQEERRLRAAGLSSGGSVALRLPPSIVYFAVLLAAWRIGAQVCLLDHRLTQHEVDTALGRLAPQLVVAPTTAVSAPLRGFFEVQAAVTRRAGLPARTTHALVQLSSGSTGPSKVIGRSAADLLSEIERYTCIEGYPRRGERVVVLASTVHVLGLVGGLLHGLHARVPVTVPDRLTLDGIARAVSAGEESTTLIGVPSQAEVLAQATEPPRLSQLVRMITGGELVRPAVRERFLSGYRAGLGAMYGMTEVGVIATDISGEHHSSLAPAPGIDLRVAGGEVLLDLPATPYVGLSDPTRWVDGWLHTRDAGRFDPLTGRLEVLGRLDSQVSVGGLKVDLTEVERTLTDIPGVENAVVVLDEVIKAFVTLSGSCRDVDLHTVMQHRLAAYKRPRLLHVLSAFPRTTSGKLVRDPALLRAAAEPETVAT